MRNSKSGRLVISRGKFEQFEDKLSLTHPSLLRRRMFLTQHYKATCFWSWYHKWLVPNLLESPHPKEKQVFRMEGYPGQDCFFKRERVEGAVCRCCKLVIDVYMNELHAFIEQYYHYTSDFLSSEFSVKPYAFTVKAK